MTVRRSVAVAVIDPIDALEETVCVTLIVAPSVADALPSERDGERLCVAVSCSLSLQVEDGLSVNVSLASSVAESDGINVRDALSDAVAVTERDRVLSSVEEIVNDSV